MMVGRSVVIWELIVVPNWSRSKCSSNDVSFLDTSDKMCNEDGASKLVGKLSLYPTSVADGASPELRMVEGILESLYLSRRSNFCSTSEVWKTKKIDLFFSTCFMDHERLKVFLAKILVMLSLANAKVEWFFWSESQRSFQLASFKIKYWHNKCICIFITFAFYCTIHKSNFLALGLLKPC